MRISKNTRRISVENFPFNMVIDGKQIAEHIYAECEKIKRNGKYLAVISYDSSTVTQSFIKQKKTAAKRLGIEIREIIELPQDEQCGGIVLQLPLPAGMDTNEEIKKIPPEKDVDNLTGNASVLAPAVAAIEEIVKVRKLSFRSEAELPNREIAIIGQGRLVGKPVLAWAQKTGIRIIHTYDMGFNPNDLKTADIIISGAGAGHIFSVKNLKRGAVVVDFGYSKSDDGKLFGDFNPEGADSPAQAEKSDITYTPTPGGTGPILVACLMRNFCELNKK